MLTIAIEDKFMRHLRLGKKGGFKASDRDQIYLHGQIKILRSLIEAKAWMLCASWFTGPCSTIYSACNKQDNSRLVDGQLVDGNAYGLVATKVTHGERKIMLPIDVHAWSDHMHTLERDDYCGTYAREIVELSEQVGSGTEPYLLVNSAKFIDTQGHRLDDDESRERMKRLAEESQERIFQRLMKGGDFIVYPFGCSLQSLLSLITSSDYCTQSRFRLQAVDNRHDSRHDSRHDYQMNLL